MAARKKPAAPQETLGERIRRLRLGKGMSQTSFGKLVGLSQRTVAYYELKGSSPAPDVLVKMADALSVTTDVLLGRKKAPGHERPAEARPPDARRVRHMKALDELPLHDRKAIFRIIEALSEKNSRRRDG